MNQLDQRYYFRSIDRRWRKELQAAKGRVLVFSPYVTSQTADLVLEHTSPTQCDVHTVISSESLAAGASSLATIKGVLARGFPLYHVPGLHAKLIIAEDTFASIGSQNLTQKSVTNLEATVAVTDPDHVAWIISLVRPWMERRTIVTMEMIEDLERQLPQLQREFRKARRTAREIDAQVRQAAQRRGRKADAQQLRRALTLQFGKDDVSEGTAKAFVRRSVWWLTHRHGPVRAPGFADRVYRSPRGWCVDFGANKFLVEVAIKRCRKTIETAICEAVEGRSVSHQELRERLNRNVAGAVANLNGEYHGYYPITSGDLVFGAQAVHLLGFLRAFFDLLRKSQLFHDEKA